MRLVNSPKRRYSPKGAQERIPLRVYVMRWTTYGLLVLSALLLLLIRLGGDVRSEVLGLTGEVQGFIVNEDGQPVADSEISLSTTPQVHVQTDSNGHFQLKRVPAGTQFLLVSRGNWGQEYPVTIQRRTITDAGTLLYLTPPVED